MGSLFEGPKIDTRPATNLIKQGMDAAKKLQPIGIDAGGLRSRFSGDSISLTSSRERRGLVSDISSEFREQAGLVEGLRGRVAPGFSDLRASRLQEIENARRSSISNLRENLARRRVLGSSFAADAETRAEIEFAQQRERVQAESFLQELDLTNQLITQEFDLTRQAFTTRLDELNVQADVGAKLVSEASTVLTAGAQLRAQLAASGASTLGTLASNQAKLDAEAQAGAGALIGQVAGVALAPMTGGLSLAALGSGGLMAPKTSTFAV